MKNLPLHFGHLIDNLVIVAANRTTSHNPRNIFGILGRKAKEIDAIDATKSILEIAIIL